jgi:CBS domain-containing protein
LSDNILVRDIMSSPVKAVREDTSLHEVIATLSNFDINAVVVVQADKLVGIVTTKDALVRGYEHGMPVREITAGMVASRPLTTIDQDTNVVEAANIMRRNHIRHLPVTDGPKLVGMLSDLDIVFTVPDLLASMEEVCRRKGAAAVVSS